MTVIYLAMGVGATLVVVLLLVASYVDLGTDRLAGTADPDEAWLEELGQ